LTLRRATALLCLLAALVPGAAAAGNASKAHAESAKQAAPLRPPDPRLFNILGVTLGRAGLDPVMAVLGKAPITSDRDALRVICYVGPDETYLVFEETDTGWGYTMYSFKTPPKELLNSNNCKALFRLNGATPNGVGLHVLQSPAELKDLLGPPLVDEKQRLEWVYSVQEPIAPGSDPRLPPDTSRVEVRTKISVRLKHGSATRIEVFASQSPVAPADAAH
jgi:hypothetical protein